MKRVTAGEAERLRSLQSQLGDRTLRTLLTSEGRRLMRPERIDNLLAGRGRLSETERTQLGLVSSNSAKLKALKQKGSGKQEFRTNRALRSWVTTGKEKDVNYVTQPKDERDSQLTAIKSLRYLGVDPSDGKFYVKKGKGK